MSRLCIRQFASRKLYILYATGENDEISDQPLFLQDVCGLGRGRKRVSEPQVPDLFLPADMENLMLNFPLEKRPVLVICRQ